MTVARDAPLAWRPAPVRRAHWRPVGLVVTVALVLAGAGWWFSHPNVLRAGTAEIGADVHVGRTVYLAGVITPSGRTTATIDVRSVRPVVGVDSAAASVAVLMCHNPATGGNDLGVAYGLSSSCTSVSSFSPGPIALDGNGVQVVLAVTPNAPGTIRIAGFDVTYRDGIRRGHQRSGVDVVVNAS